MFIVFQLMILAKKVSIGIWRTQAVSEEVEAADRP